MLWIDSFIEGEFQHKEVSKDMGHLNIHCNGCGSDWIVYHRDDWKNWKARTCPVCGKSIDPGTWDRSVLKAFGEMEDATIELVKDHTQSHGTLFTIGYVPDVMLPDRSEEDDHLRADIEDVKDGIESLRKMVTRLDSIFQI